MIYILIILSVLWLITVTYFLKHIRLITKELESIDKEQHTQNMDIIHLLKMNVEISKALDNHAKVLNQMTTVTEYLLELNNKEIIKKGPSDIFSPPKGEA